MKQNEMKMGIERRGGEEKIGKDCGKRSVKNKGMKMKCIVVDER